jgi:ankyrin repeat protein
MPFTKNQEIVDNRCLPLTIILGTVTKKLAMMTGNQVICLNTSRQQSRIHPKRRRAMNEKDALKKFRESTICNDLPGASEALKHISAETINFQDDDDYDMLIQATVDGNSCAVEALLEDGRCDLTHVENLCGMSAYDFSKDYAPDSRIYQLFQLKKYHPIKLFNFFTAILKNDIEAVTAHLAAGVHPDLNKNYFYNMPPGFMSELPLALAAKQNSVEMAKILLEYGALPDAYCRKNEKTPLQIAEESPDMLKILLEK